MADDQDDYAKDSQIGEPLLKAYRPSRVGMKAGSRYWWETKDNAKSERAIARREAGVGKDIELPKDTKPIAKPRAMRGGKR